MPTTSAPAATTLTAEIKITLDPVTQKYVDENAGGELTAKLSAWVTYWLQATAAGGFMLNPDEVKYIESISKVAVPSSKMLIAICEAATSRTAGQFSPKIEIDPSWIEPLKEIAAQQGRENVTSMIQDFVNDTIQEVYGYNLKPEATATFTRAQKKEIDEIVGKKNCFGADIYNWIKSIGKKKAA